MIPHKQPSYLDNPRTQRNIHDSEDRARQISEQHRDLVDHVRRDSDDYRHQYRDLDDRRTNVYRRYYDNDDYRYYYSGWYRHGFYGGYYYPVRPCDDIDVYFFYPVVFWFYVDDWDPDYYRVWYPDYDRYEVVPFVYARDYFPSDTLRDLGIEVSAMPDGVQDNFRTAMVNLTEALVQQISNNLQSTFTLSTNDVVINHYENLQDVAIEVEGFVDRGSLHLPFKALLNLQDPSQTLVFVPTTQEPTDSDLYTLNVMNQRIEALGGNPFVADQEPVQVTTGP